MFELPGVDTPAGVAGVDTGFGVCPRPCAGELPLVITKGDGEDLSGCSESFSFGLGLGLMINRVADEAAMESGAAIGLPPIPKRLKEGVGVLSGEAKPRGRTLALDFGEARYAE